MTCIFLLVGVKNIPTEFFLVPEHTAFYDFTAYIRAIYQKPFTALHFQPEGIH